ncbi:MAG: hypothetical protein K5799_05380 [Erythrobacter sp.]|nr:hypothetical protein [Erythrobacter sp.]
MTVQDMMQFPIMMGTAWLIISTRNRLRINPPRVRVALGLAGTLFAVLAFYGMIKLPPRLWYNESSVFVDIVMWVTASAIGGLIVLSLIQIVGGTMQALRLTRGVR